MQVVNRSQQVVTAGLSPKAEYSRVVSVAVDLDDDDLFRWAVTPKLGNKIWLLKVDVWVFPYVINEGMRVLFEIRQGDGEPTTENIFNSWENILPLYNEDMKMVEWKIYDGQSHRQWTMKRRFIGKSIRFGVKASRSINAGHSKIWVSFEISEG